MNKLSSKITIFMIFVFLLAGIPSYYQYTVSEDILTEELFDHLKTAASSRASHIETFLDMMEGRMIDFASDGKIKDCLYDIKYKNSEGCGENELTEHLIQNKLPAIETLLKVSTMNSKGNVVASTEELTIGEDHSSKEHFQKGLKEATVSDVHYDESLNQIVLTITAPVIRNDELVGVVLGQISPDQLFSILEDRTGFGNTGETYIVGKDKIAKSPLLFKENEILTQQVETEITQRCFTSQHDHEKHKFNLPTTYLDYHGEKSLGTHEHIKDTEWCLIAELDESEALAFQKKLLQIAASIGIFVLIIVLLSLIYFTRKNISEPIKKLSLAANQLEKGNFKTKVSIQTKDELEQLGKTFNKTVKALGKVDAERLQIDKAKTEFLSITSHELRSPMTPMKAQLQMLLGNYFGKLNTKQKNSIEIVLNNTSRLDRIIVDFLEISRIEAARLKFIFTKTNLRKHIKDVITEMEGFLPEKKIKITSKIGNLPTIEVDADRVMQVLRNLLNNAIKFSKTNGKIEVSATQKNNMIQFSVKDNGIGIPPNKQKKVFEPFFQAEETMYRKYQGTGLGLSICKGIIESQNGKIWLESVPGKGSTFHFTIPLKPVKETKPIKILFSAKKI